MQRLSVLFNCKWNWNCNIAIILIRDFLNYFNVVVDDSGCVLKKAGQEENKRGLIYKKIYHVIFAKFSTKIFTKKGIQEVFNMQETYPAYYFPNFSKDTCQETNKRDRVYVEKLSYDISKNLPKIREKTIFIRRKSILWFCRIFHKNVPREKRKNYFYVQGTYAMKFLVFLKNIC